MSSDSFEPVRMLLVDTSQGPALVVEDDAGQRSGIVVPVVACSVLTEFLKTSGPRFVRLWKAYEAGRGGAVFLWDLAHLATLIASSTQGSWLRQLARVRDATEVFHNTVQAHIMTLAEELYPGGVRLGRPSPPRRSPDFYVDCPTETAFEIESIPKPYCLQLVDEGTRLAPPDVRGLQLYITKRAEKGFSQVGRDGTTVVAIWCDHLAALVAANPAWNARKVEVQAAISPSKLVVCTRPSQAVLSVFLFNRDDWKTAVVDLCSRLARPVPRGSVSLSLTGPLSVARGTNWISVGRILWIDNSTGCYSPDELLTVQAHSSIESLSDEELNATLGVAQFSHDQATAAVESLAKQPLDQPRYPLQQLLQDQRFRDLYSAAAKLSSVVAALPIATTRIEDSDRIVTDARRFGSIATQLLATSPNSAGATRAMRELLGAPNPFNLVRRVAHLYSVLISREREQRLRVAGVQRML